MNQLTDRQINIILGTLQYTHDHFATDPSTHETFFSVVFGESNVDEKEIKSVYNVINDPNFKGIIDEPTN